MASTAFLRGVGCLWQDPDPDYARRTALIDEYGLDAEHDADLINELEKRNGPLFAKQGKGSETDITPISRKVFDKLIKRLQTAIPDSKVLVSGLAHLPERMRMQIESALRGEGSFFANSAASLDWLNKQQSNSAEVAQLAKQGINISQEIADAKKNVEKFQNPISDADVELMLAPSTSKSTASPIGFYSRVDRTLTDKLPNKATPDQILGLLNPQKGSGIKELDPEYQALKLWLDDQKGTLAKADVLDFVRANKVNVENVVLGEPVPQRLKFNEVDVDTSMLSPSSSSAYAIDDSDTITEQWESDGYTIIRDHNDRYFAFDEQNNEIDDPGNRGGYFSNFQAAVDAANEQAAIDRGSSTRFPTYTLPGDTENYREEFLTAQGEPPYGPNGEIYNIDHEWSDGHSEYSDIQNPIVRLRYDDRETADGDSMLFNEEVQQPSKANLAKMPKVYQKYGEEIGWRRLVHKAVSEGYDYLGFTTGEQQAERYDLGRVVKSIASRPSFAGDKRVEIEVAHQSEPIAFTVGEDGIVATGGPEGFYNKHLSDVVGKDIAKQILESTEPLTIEGEGLKIGGKELANRYDKNAVEYLNKFLKPYGGKVELVRIGNDESLGALLDDKGREVWSGTKASLNRQIAKDPNFTTDHTLVGFGTQVHAVKITPEMREAFGQDKGVPLLMQNHDLLGATFPDGTVWLNENHLNANTPIHEFGHLWSKMFPDRWNKGMDFIRKTPAGRKLMDSLRELYGDNEQTLANEALAHAAGKQGEGIFTGSLLTRFKNWLKDLYRRIAGKFGRTVSDSDGIDDLARNIASELLGGRELRPTVEPRGPNENSILKSRPKSQGIPGEVDLWGNATQVHALQQDLFGEGFGVSEMSKARQAEQTAKGLKEAFGEDGEYISNAMSSTDDKLPVASLKNLDEMVFVASCKNLDERDSGFEG